MFLRLIDCPRGARGMTDSRTWLFGEGRIDPNVVEMNLRRGQLNNDKRITRRMRNHREGEGVRDAQDTQGEPHVIVRGQLLPSHTKDRKTSRCLATLNTAEDTAYASDKALRPHLDDEGEPVPLPTNIESGQTLSDRTCRARSGRV